MHRLGSVAHLLEVNTFRVHLENACRDLSWQLSFWLCPDELIPLMGDRQLIPDGYFRIARQVDGQTRQSAFFIETERMAKRSAVVKSKISRYLRFQQNGYHEAFGTRSVRVLFLFSPGSEFGLDGTARAAALHADEYGATFVRARLRSDELLLYPATHWLTSALWLRPASPSPVALFDK